jgi:hypothetical protein
LKPYLQKRIDAQEAEAEDRRVSSQLNVKHDSEFYQRICRGLSQKRADDYGYWSKVCLALGHERAGLSVVMAFSRRSSKFNEYSVRKTYEQGERGFSGRPLTCGTLMAYLKEDNLKAFHKLLPESAPDDDMAEMVMGMTGEEEEEEEEDEDCDVYETEETPEKKKTQEEKLSRWLANPSYFLEKPVSEPVDALEDDDDVDVYSERYMKEYEPNSTTIVKGMKGQGKTHQLVEYIKKHEPKRIAFISFRRSFSKELLKRLAPLGFVDYRSIEGEIKDDVACYHPSREFDSTAVERAS